MTSAPLRTPGDAPADSALLIAGSPAPATAGNRTVPKWEPTRHHERGWAARYRRTLLSSDAIVVATAVLLAYLLRFGTEPQRIAVMQQTIPFVLVTLVLGTTWLGCLRLTGGYDARVFGAGADEYSRVARASFWLFGGLAIAEVLFRPEIARGFEAIALPLGTVGLLVTRWIWRRRLSARRVNGEALERLLIVGSVESSAALTERLPSSIA